MSLSESCTEKVVAAQQKKCLTSSTTLKLQKGQVEPVWCMWVIRRPIGNVRINKLIEKGEGFFENENVGETCRATEPCHLSSVHV